MTGIDYPETPDWQIDPHGVPPAPPTWGPVDLAACLNGTYRPPTPTLMPRADGQCLLYPGLVHSIHGESESGKSWIAQAEAARLLGAGQRVLYVDFESDPWSITGRLTELGVPRRTIIDLFDYRRPSANPAVLTEQPAWMDLLATPYALAVIDGVTDALSLWAVKSIDNDQVTEWMRRFPKPLAEATGAAVLMIDHVTKSGDGRGRFAIGGQAKMAGLTGAAYTVDVKEPLGRGLRGVLALRVGKDRPGAVRGWAGEIRAKDRTQDVGTFVLDGTGPRLTATIHPPAISTGEFRPTTLMERISLFVEANQGASVNDILRGVSGKTDAKHAALKVLISEGYLSSEQVGRGHRHSSAVQFRASMDGIVPPLPDRSPDVPR